MKKNIGKQNIKNAKASLEELDALGFIVVKYTEWHWRISKDDYKLEIDVWPSRNKLMSLKTYKPRLYTNLLEEIKLMFNNEIE